MTGSRPVLSRFGDLIRAVTYGNPLYTISLAGRTPGVLAVVPPDPWPGDARRGAELLAGQFHFAGESRHRDDFRTREDFWLGPGGPPDAWRVALHSFDWLRDLRTVSGDDARRAARRLVFEWLDANAVWNETSWGAPLLGARISNWIGLHDFFCASADDGFRWCVFDSLARQTRHLRRVVPGSLTGEPLVVALKGLIYGTLCLTGGDRAVAEAVRLLLRELPRQILPDGGHAERNPSRLLRVLRHLIDIRAALRVARIEVPDEIQNGIERMTPALRFFRHGDGRLAQFNGSREDWLPLIDTVLAQSDCRARVPRRAAFSGFERVAGGRSVLLIDAGKPAPAPFDQTHHAGALAFEFSSGRDRLIVNCGSHPGPSPLWRAAEAASAAHSTLVLAETNSAEVRSGGGLGRRPGEVGCARQEVAGGTVVTASHDGYARLFGRLHRRRLYLADSGDDLRGEDSLEPVPPLKKGQDQPKAKPKGKGKEAGAAADDSRPFVIRFHLHPAVEVIDDHEDATIRLRLPSGAIWCFSAAGARLASDDSVYLGAGRDPQPCRQLTLSGSVGGDAPVTVKWALRREGAVIVPPPPTTTKPELETEPRTEAEPQTVPQTGDAGATAAGPNQESTPVTASEAGAESAPADSAAADRPAAAPPGDRSGP